MIENKKQKTVESANQDTTEHVIDCQTAETV